MTALGNYRSFGFFWVALAAFGLAQGAFSSDVKIIEDFQAEALPANLTLNDVEVELVPGESGNSLKVHFSLVDWPNVFFTAPEGGWDWSEYEGLAVDVINLGSESVRVCMRVDGEGEEGATNWNTSRALIAPGTPGVLKNEFVTEKIPRFWGMRGVPGKGPLPGGKVIDSSKISAFQVFVPRQNLPHTLVLDNFRLFGKSDDEKEIPFPFVDRFGQYIHEDWPGKAHEEKDLLLQKQTEREDLLRNPKLPGRDEYGGWAEGPQLEGTGWFRTEKLDGKWWLVTPGGHLFFSTGMDCVGTWERTFVEGRDDWFEWLPEEEDPAAQFYGHAENVHSMAESIGGKGRTFSFYCTNLVRKYGDEWNLRWREETYRRLVSWGFNTVANWSQDDVLENSPIPFVKSIGFSGDHRRIEGGGGYWAKMHDAYDPAFKETVDKSLEHGTKKFAENPLCIGYFVDNELSWGSDENPDIALGSLKSPVDQPCRIAFVKQLQEKYASIDSLNAGWETDAESWDTLRPPEKPNEACRSDLEAFVRAFSLEYFRTVQGAVEEHAPNQLYLGCRFAGFNHASVEACAEVSDIVSFNIYKPEVSMEQYGWLVDLDKPTIIGEFHFGALDRGMFHTGLVPTENQEKRAASYIHYVRSVADHPTFVGCHWFQYIDEPITGRFFDGENYNIGFLNVLDAPYPEMVEAARKVHAEVYRRRAGGK